MSTLSLFALDTQIAQSPSAALREPLSDVIMERESTDMEDPDAEERDRHVTVERWRRLSGKGCELAV